MKKLFIFPTLTTLFLASCSGIGDSESLRTLEDIKIDGKITDKEGRISINGEDINWKINKDGDGIDIDVKTSFEGKNYKIDLAKDKDGDDQITGININIKKDE